MKTLYDQLKSKHKEELLSQEYKYPSAIKGIIEFLKENIRYRDLTIEQAYDLRTFTGSYSHIQPLFADDLFKEKTTK